MGGQDRMETMQRHWLLLNMIPRQPRTTHCGVLRARLSAKGYETTPRTVQRDLEKLSYIFPLTCDDAAKPYRWSWMADAPLFELPGIDPPAALAFRLVEQYLTPLLPRAAIQGIAPYLLNAGKVLDHISENRLRSWPQKIHVVPRGQPLRAPEIGAEVLEKVGEALLTECRLRASYRKKGETVGREYEVSPLGLIFQDRLVYLVGTLWDYDDPVLLPLHRFTALALIRKGITVPEGFDLREYAERELRFPEGEKPLKLQVLFAAEAAAHLAETPLTDDQRLTARPDGQVLLRGTVADTAQLRWWLLGFGDQVEVLGPKSLREEFRTISVSLAKRYGVGDYG